MSVANGRRTHVLSVLVVAVAISCVWRRASWAGANPPSGKGSAAFAAATTLFERSVDRGGRINPEPFLAGIEELRPILQALGVAVFKTFDRPIYGNVALMRARSAATESLVAPALEDIEAGRHRAPGNAALALGRLHRNTEFIVGIFEELGRAEASGAVAKLTLGDITLRAYHRTLEPHHPRFLRACVNNAMWLLPSREELYRRLGYDEAKFGFVKRPGRELALCARAMAPGLRQLELFFTAHRIGRL